MYRVGTIHWIAMALMAAALLLGFRAAERAFAPRPT
jgi:hypothetical protein